MKKSIIFLLILTFNCTYCQTRQNKIVLTTNGELQYKTNSNDEFKPLGNNVKVTYDKFFKNYIIEYTNSKGNRMLMYFDFDSKEEYIFNKKYYLLSKYNLHDYYSLTFSEFPFINNSYEFFISYYRKKAK